MALTWLHLSDFHIRAGDPYDRDVVLGALIASVRGFAQRGHRPEIVFATGDVAFSGKPGEYELATVFFNDLMKAVGLDRSRLFVIPGNHDVDRDRSIGLARSLVSREEADKYFVPSSPRPHLTQKQAAYLDWYREFFKGIRDPPSTSCGPLEVVDAGGIRVGILPINSALFCLDHNDHAKLWVGRRSLDDAVRALTDVEAELRIALIHHPLDWLADLERPNIRAKLAGNLDLVLRGHLHETDVEQVVSPQGQLLHLAAGAAYQTRDWPNRAMFVTVESSSLTVLPIRYEDSPAERWTLDPSLFPDDPNYTGSVRLTRRAPPLTRAPSFGSADATGVRGRHVGGAVHVPVRMRAIAEALDLSEWASGFDASRWEGYFETVDAGRLIIRRHQAAGEAGEVALDQLVPMIAQALEGERALIDLMLDRSEVQDDARWVEILEAAAWQILRRYALAVDNGDWKPQ
jgi:predicted MPP superfamily phosphohydrolase